MDRLGWSDDPDLLYGIKPKGMHWKTYYRLVGELEHWEHEANFGFATHFLERFAHLADLG